MNSLKDQCVAWYASKISANVINPDKKETLLHDGFNTNSSQINTTRSIDIISDMIKIQRRINQSY